MKIQKFIIENYRAIEKVELLLNFSINPIIGINEAGKTSILKAILCFDRTRDKFNGGDHLVYQNNYVTTQNKSCNISAIIKLDKQEIKELISKLNLQTSTIDFNECQKFNENTEFILSRNLSTLKYSYKNEKILDITNEKITSLLVSKIPYILYFDDFADRVPEEIEFPSEFVTNKKLSKSKIRDWQEIIQEIFKRADTESIEDGNEQETLISYLKVKDTDTKADILSDVQDTLNREIIKEWKRIKKSGNNFADDSDKLELVIVNEKNNFKFKVKDKSNNNKTRTFDISERSKGFQWFFNYMIKLKFNPNYKGKLENTIFLLDEPGSYLHSSAQSELLKELQSVSQKNTIIYCTHSQFLLNPEIIKLGSIKIAEKKDATIKLKSFGEFKNKNDKGALSPIYQALNLNFANDFVGKIIITEGITDYYFFKILQTNTELINKKINFIPSSGASQSSALISLAISFSENFLIFLDNDKAGKGALKKYSKEFGDEIKNNIIIYHENKKSFLLEDFLSKEDTEELLNITNSIDPKRALSFLFYDYKNIQENFITNLSKETIDNIKETIAKVNLKFY
jgi:predicted ATP-dependent endonuclease of OLD family